MDTVVRTATAKQSNRTGRSDQSKDAQTKGLRQSSENNGLPLARHHRCWQRNFAVKERLTPSNPVCERNWAPGGDYPGEQIGQKTGSPGSILSGFPTAVTQPLSPHRPHGTDGRVRSSERGFRASVTVPLLRRSGEDGRVSDPGNVREYPPIRDWLPIAWLAVTLRNTFLALFVVARSPVSRLR